LILLSVPVFTFVYNDNFALSARIFNIYALTLLSRVMINQVYCYVHHDNWVLTWSTAAEVVINIVLSLLLMQWLGLIGIPLATVLAYAIQKAFITYYIRRKYGVRLSEYIPVQQCIWYFAGMILCVMAEMSTSDAYSQGGSPVQAVLSFVRCSTDIRRCLRTRNQFVLLS
jgi:peptidoglycan biosynthesis protein MviN/MurJ (putative lipid II flippase)